MVCHLQVAKLLQHIAEMSDFWVDMTNTDQISEFMCVAVNAYSMFMDLYDGYGQAPVFENPL